MKRLGSVIQTALLLALTGIAIFFGTGCLFTDPTLNQVVLPFLTGVEIWNVCVPQGNGFYERYTVAVAPDGTTTDRNMESTSRSSDCDYSVGTEDQVDSSAVQASMGQTTTSAPASGGQAQARAISSTQHPVDALPYMRPAPFLPLFSSVDAKSAPVTCDPNGSFYSVNHTNALVTHFASCTLSVLATISVFGHPLHPATTPDGSLLLVTSNDGAVNFISTATDAVVYTLPTPGVYPSGIAISPDGNTAYVTNYDVNSKILVIDIPSRTITGTIPLPVLYPKQIFLTPDGVQAWVNFYSSPMVYIIDTFSGTIVTGLNMGSSASTGIAFNATGTRAYIAVSPSDLYIFDTATLQLITDVKVGAQPVDVVLSVDGSRVYVTSFGSSTISIVDAHTNQLLTKITAPAADQRAFSLAPLVP